MRTELSPGSISTMDINITATTNIVVTKLAHQTGHHAKRKDLDGIIITCR